MSQSARDAILARIRHAKKERAIPSADFDGGMSSPQDPPAHIIPAQGRLSGSALWAQFREKLERQSATVTEVSGQDAVLPAILHYLDSRGLPFFLRMGEDPRLKALPWSAHPELVPQFGPAEKSDRVSLTWAFAGIGETGTLMLLSGPHNPATLTFLPETHLVLVSQADIFPNYEAAWAHLMAGRGKDGLPRTVTYVSGPSRTGDIEQTIILGAHGPKAVHVIIVS